MTATLPINTSSTFAGTGTAQATITTAGLYTCQVKTTLPHLDAGTPVTSSPANNIVNVTCAADSSGSKNSTWWKFYTANDTFGYYVWYNINSAGVDPAPSGLTGIEVDGATDATAATLATATIAAIAASSAASYVTASAGASGHVILTNVQYGACTAAANGTASYGASFSVTQAGSSGVPAASGVSVKILKNSTVVASAGFPSPTQPFLGVSTTVSCAASDTVSVVIASASSADSNPNAVKSTINLYQGE